MRISKLTKNMLKYLPVLAVLVATVVGLLIGKDLYPLSLGSQSKTIIQSPIGPNNPPLLQIPGFGSPCFYSDIYTSLPPKCKTFDGEFIPLPGTSNVLVIPQGK
jgi:hypothetical protein